MEFNKPRIILTAWYGSSPPIDYKSKEEVPARHPTTGEPLRELYEHITTRLRVGSPIESRKEESNSAVENVPDQTS